MRKYYKFQEKPEQVEHILTEIEDNLVPYDDKGDIHIDRDIHCRSIYVEGDSLYINGIKLQSPKYDDDQGVIKYNRERQQFEYGYEPSQVIRVAKKGGDFDTIQGAIDSITDATSAKRYCVFVNSGVYNENVTCKNYVDIIGSGRTNSIIYATTGTALTFPSTKCTVSEIGINVDYGTLTANSSAIVSAGADSVLKDCDITVTKSGGDFTMYGLDITAGSFRMSDCYFSYTDTSGATDTQLVQSIVRQTGVLTTVIMNNNEIIASTTDTNDDLVGFETTATITGECILSNNLIYINAGAAGSSATGLWLYGTADSAIFIQNRIVVNCNASAYGFWIDSTAGGAVVETRHNVIIVTSVGAAEGFDVATGDTIYSTYDKITAKTPFTGAGTIVYASSPVDGEIATTGRGVFAGVEVRGKATANIAIGDATTLDALDTTPTYNIAIGNGAGSGITDGDNNVLIGYRAGYSKANSSGCIAIGHETAYSGSTIGGLTAVGYQAMRYHSTGNGNTCIGYQAGLGDFGGAAYTYNTFIGEMAGVSCNDGGSNVCLGKNAGHELYDGDRNIFLGYSAGYRQTDNTDLLIVDNQIRADVATEASNAIIYGVMAAAVTNQSLSINADLDHNGDKAGFFGTAPVAQPAAVADATDAASAITQLNLLLAKMRDLGLIAT